MKWVRKEAMVSHVIFTSLKATVWTGWYFDSGCSMHMTGNKAHLTNIEEVKTDYVTFGGGEKDKIIENGSLNVTRLPNLKDVLLVEGLTANLISISQLCDNDMKVAHVEVEDHFFGLEYCRHRDPKVSMGSRCTRRGHSVWSCSRAHRELIERLIETPCLDGREAVQKKLRRF
ncbi:hypothetical protein LIER_42664 [Lithospermum erythrorhizon]|uniref:Retrovirus-related Pol polyprotein from transposon TNT 1-94-like beta-barrel domain-containing protein n=1 Tax=Lithospermum erythrorhizon TaxID=34254 RepID=A0AAV3NV00_LITER